MKCLPFGSCIYVIRILPRFVNLSFYVQHDPVVFCHKFFMCALSLVITII